MQSQNKDITLVYFGLRGRAETARLLFHLGNIKFTDERQSFPQFGADKASGRYKFGQLPVLYVNKKQYVQSMAINNYAAQIAGFYPKNPLEVLTVEQAQNTIAELLDLLVVITYTDKYNNQQKEEQIQGRVRTLFNYIVSLIQENQTGYFVGNKLTLPDIQLYTLVQEIYLGGFPLIDQQFISQYPEIVRLHKIISLKPEVVAFEQKYNSN